MDKAALKEIDFEGNGSISEEEAGVIAYAFTGKEESLIKLGCFKYLVDCQKVGKAKLAPDTDRLKSLKYNDGKAQFFDSYQNITMSIAHSYPSGKDMVECLYTTEGTKLDLSYRVTCESAYKIQSGYAHLWRCL